MGFSDKKWLKLTRIRDFKCYQPYWNMIQHQLSKKETFRSHTRTCKFAIWVLFNKKVAIESPFPTYKEIPKIIYISISGVYSWDDLITDNLRISCLSSPYLVLSAPMSSVSGSGVNKPVEHDFLLKFV